MKIVCIGDSLTEGDYGIYGKRGIANVCEKNYPFFLQKLANCHIVNEGYCGYTSSTFYANRCLTNQLDVTEADYILILLGTNGGMSVTEETDCNVDYYKIVDYCNKQAPNANLVLLTPSFATQNPHYSNCGYYNNVLVSAQKVRQIAKELGLPLIDLFAYDEFNEQNVCKYQANDGLHFVEEGYKVLAQYIFDSLCNIYPNFNCNK